MTEYIKNAKVYILQNRQISSARIPGNKTQLRCELVRDLNHAGIHVHCLELTFPL